MIKSKKLTWLMVFMFMTTMFAGFGDVPTPVAAADLNDISNHWAKSQIEDMVSKGVVAGYPDNTFIPDKSLTRAEFMVMVNRAFNLTATATTDYTDVNATDWFATEIAKAKAAGYITGYEDGTMRPNNLISRQEIAVILAKMLNLDTSVTTGLEKFKDVNNIPAWSKGAVAALVRAGYLNGYPDGTFKATQSISRAESAVVLSKAMTKAPNVKTYDQAGTYGPAEGTEVIDGNVVVKADGVVLQNLVIKGDLIIAEEVAAGDVTLNNLTVEGETILRAGGKNSIHINGGKYNKIRVEKTHNGEIRIVATNAAGIDVVVGEKVKGDTIILEGTFNSVTIAAENVKIQTQQETKISELIVEPTAKNSTITLNSKSEIEKLVLDASAEIKGQGTVKEAEVNANGVTYEKKPVSEKVDPGVTQTPKVTTPSSGGGGGGGSSVVAPTISGVTIEGIAPVVNGTQLTFGVIPTNEYATGNVTLSHDTAYTVESGSYTITGTAKTTDTNDTLITNALSLLAAEGLASDDGKVFGSTLISNSPFTLTLASTANANYKTVYTINFAQAPTLDNVMVGGIAPEVNGTQLRFTVTPTTKYTTGTATLSEDVSYIISNNDYNITGDITTAANLMQTALDLLATNGGGNGVLGQTLIDNAPLTITITSKANPSVQNVYTVDFVSDAL